MSTEEINTMGITNLNHNELVLYQDGGDFYPANVINPVMLPLYPDDDQSERSKGCIFRMILRVFCMKLGNYDIRSALITFLTMVSAHLGEALALFVTEEKGVSGRTFLKFIEGLVNKNLISENHDLNKNLNSGDKNLFKNKTIIAYTTASIKKNVDDLRMLVETGELRDKSGPASLILLVGQSAPSMLNDFPALRLNLAFNHSSTASRMTHSFPNEEILVMIQHISDEIAFVKPTVVNIPFFDQIIRGWDIQNPEIAYTFNIMEKYLKIIAMIRNIRILTKEEAWNERYKYDQTDMPKIITCCRADYEIFYYIFEERFQTNQESVTEIERVIFEAVNRINRKMVYEHSMDDPRKMSARELIKILNTHQYPEFSRTWASVLHIQEDIENTEHKKFSTTQIKAGLKGLIGKGFIAGRDDGSKTGEHVYRISAGSLGEKTMLPHPDDIFSEGGAGHSGLLTMTSHSIVD